MAASLVNSGLTFLRGTYGAIVLAVAAVTDPLKWPQAFGYMTDKQWLISPELRQALCAGLAFLWMFVWYHHQRVAFEGAQPQEPNMPLHQACRWIARDSVWAANSPPGLDDNWVSRVDRELMSKVMMGRLELFGERTQRGSGRGPMQHVVPDFKDGAQWDSNNLVSDEPPTHMWSNGGDMYYNVMVDDRQIKRLWPRRSLWHRLWGRSPIERLGGYGYGGIFAKQDQFYRERQGFAQPPLEAILR